MRPTPILMLPLIAGLAACAGSEMPTPEQGRAVFEDNCTSCHGYRAEGDTLIGGQQAPDLTRIAARNGGTFPRAGVLSQIDGYHRDKVPDDVMPRFGDLMSDDDLVPVEVEGTMTPTPRPLAALMFYLESIQRP